ncbi:YARHG domain-containing protein [Legionella gresilensis]|uniref:YARHG domain-containing protein n=1 Tax=Legionella gresilensis TaxID=91823 RepID=UPI001041901B|nr:YARHG domain-containing protein [Legionella gresilensis]
MMVKAFITRLTLLSLGTVITAQANDTAFGGTGASPYPIEQPNIKMAAEKIIITGHNLNKENRSGFWDYQCSFLFENNLNKPITIQMGFPFPVNNEEFGNISIPAGRQSKQGAALVYDFVATARNKPIAVRKQRITSNKEKGLEYQEAYIWNFSFLPKETVTLNHHYNTGVTFDVMGYHWVNYVLKTGKLWQGGRIGRTEIDIIPNTPTRLCSELNKNAHYTKPKPKGMKILGKGKDRHYVWNLKNFSPDDDLSVCLQTGRNYIRYRVVYPLLEENLTRLRTMNAEQLTLIKNTIYAQYGRQFENSKLQRYFNRQWWYEPNSGYSDKLLTVDDQKILAAIHQLELKKAS